MKVGKGEKVFACSLPEDEEEYKGKCTICSDRSRKCVIWRCMHHATCLKCVKTLDRCPICREDIEDVTSVRHF